MATRERIDALLSEPVAVAEERERTMFAAQLANSDGTVILFGAGRLGRLCARALRRGGVPLRAFCDGNVALHGTSVEGADVLALDEAALRFGSSALFVVAIWTGTARESMLERIAYLRARGCRTVVPYPALVWAHGREETPFHSFDLPSRILAHRAELREVGRLLADDVSLHTYAIEMARRLLGEFAETPPAPNQYFPRDLIAPAEDEVFVDGGAYTGDTLMDFLRFLEGRFSAYHGIEADPTNASRLRKTVTRLPDDVRSKCAVHEVALHSRAEALSFAAVGSTTSQSAVAGQHQVRGVPLDDLLRNHRMSFLKLDVEGAEPEALAGAEALLHREQPIAAVCVYHCPDHLWSIPLALHAPLPRHRFALRCHGQDGWESVCYVIPESRCCLR
jgi:FkbM family methyltransferase